MRRRRRRADWATRLPTWREACPALIAGALKRASARPSGNWFVVGASRDVRAGGRPCGRTVGGVEVVLWRSDAGELQAGPGACPHLGAPLRDSRVRCGTLVCHWHGLVLDGGSFAGWDPYPVHDDGVLVWVRLDTVGGEEPSERPVVPVRPAAGSGVDAVFQAVGRCEPQDVVANRLDPWHGSWFHPYSFVDLTVARPPRGEEEDDAFVVDVSFRVTGSLVAPVRAEFTAPEPRTVVMRITEGEGVTSVVETHATPLTGEADERPRTAVVEAVVAASDRRGFALARAAAPALRPLMRRTAARLWRDDLAYAERRWALRSTGRFPA
ncbi:Rieske (2Fe-2S) protein [Streptomyces sp. N2-109]|uniref:Rieske (2Fe-2S) protein n=1 Tax=Streptomyces gossypii TaxID=2883101 RepID=A0ABT2K3Q9_9ACTN|nr:Rieske (2Fe-2S) protein [Streptomyces gossypii]MCT2594810.1 Rieske (2Fe-2S) protein [Streptomyces gossypii]